MDTQNTRAKAYQESDLNSEIFANKKLKMVDMYKSTSHFFNKDYIKEGNTFIDIGGGGALLML